MTDSEDPPKPTLLHKLNAAKGLILAIVALLTAASSFLKPQDQTATKNSYEWSAKRIEELSAQDVQLRQDIIAIRNYLEGYVQAQSAARVTPPQTTTARGEGVGLGSGSGFGSGAGRLGGARRPRPSAMGAVDAILSAPAPEPEPLPQVKAMPKQMDAPDFAQILLEEPTSKE